MPQQFANPANPEVHRRTTAEEIWRDTDGRGRRLRRRGRHRAARSPASARMLRERSPETLRRRASSPPASPVLSGGMPGPHKIQGIGAGFVPEVLDRTVIDEIIAVDDEDALETARSPRSARASWSGSPPGPTSRRRSRSRARPEMAGKRVVTIVCDSGERYMSLPFFCTMSSWKQAGGRRFAPTSPRRAIATLRRRRSRPSRSCPAGPGCRRCSPTGLAHALLEAGVPIVPRMLAYVTRVGDRGRDPPGGEDRPRVLHRPRLRRGDRRDRRDRRARDALPGRDPGRHRLSARQAPPDPRATTSRSAPAPSCSARSRSATAPRSAPTRS